jgi:hypothetical protein
MTMKMDILYSKLCAFLRRKTTYREFFRHFGWRWGRNSLFNILSLNFQLVDCSFRATKSFDQQLRAATKGSILHCSNNEFHPQAI